MALNKDILGQALFDAQQAFNNKTKDELIAEYGTIDAARLALEKAKAQAIILHITGSAEVSVSVSTTGTATAQTGSGTGNIS